MSQEAVQEMVPDDRNAWHRTSLFFFIPDAGKNIFLPSSPGLIRVWLKPMNLSVKYSYVVKSGWLGIWQWSFMSHNSKLFTLSWYPVQCLVLRWEEDAFRRERDVVMDASCHLNTQSVRVILLIPRKFSPPLYSRTIVSRSPETWESWNTPQQECFCFLNKWIGQTYLTLSVLGIIRNPFCLAPDEFLFQYGWFGRVLLLCYRPAQQWMVLSLIRVPSHPRSRLTALAPHWRKASSSMLSTCSTHKLHVSCRCEVSFVHVRQRICSWDTKRVPQRKLDTNSCLSKQVIT